MRALAAALLTALVVASSAASSSPSIPVSVTVAPAGTRVAWVDGITWQVWVADTDGTHARKVGRRWTQGVGQLTWTRDGLVVDSNYTLSLLSQTGRQTKLAVVPDSVFSVGGDLAAVGSGQVAGPAAIVNLRTRRVVHVGGAHSVVGEPSLSGDGRRLAWTSGGVWSANSDGSGARRVVARGTCPALSPNGRRLAYEAIRGTHNDLFVGTRLLLADVGGACPAVWSPDSAKLAIAFGPARLAVVDVRTGDVRETPVALGRVTGMSWAPDTASLVASFRRGGCGDVVRLDAATLAATTLVHGCP